MKDLEKQVRLDRYNLSKKIMLKDTKDESTVMERAARQAELDKIRNGKASSTI